MIRPRTILYTSAADFVMPHPSRRDPVVRPTVPGLSSSSQEHGQDWMGMTSHGLYRGLTNYGDQEFARLFSRGRSATRPAVLAELLDQAGRRDSHLDQRLQQLPPGPAGTRRGGQTRRARGRRLPMGPHRLAREGPSAPTAMYVPQLMAMDVEEMVRGEPMDAVSAGRRLATRRARAADGRVQRRPAGDPAGHPGPMMTGRHHGDADGRAAPIAAGSGAGSRRTG